MTRIQSLMLILLVSLLPVGLLAQGDLNCCVGRVGDVNQSGADEPTIGDVAYLIDCRFITVEPPLDLCYAEADINQSGGANPTWQDITIGDISYLVDYLFITGASMGLPECLEQTTEPTGHMSAMSDCKMFMEATEGDPVPENQECVAYDYDGMGNLSIIHQNAGFNCCPEITHTIAIQGSSITITEIETAGLCDCLCLFDLEYELINIMPGEYDVVVNGAYADPIAFTVDFSAAVSGQYCEERTHYPWGMGAPSGALIDHGTCKDQGAALADPTPDNQSCIEYTYDGAGTLSLTHVNAGFNCCPTALMADFTFDGNVITVTESEDLSGGGCYCLCLYDLEFEITDLPPGEYHFIFVEPLVELYAMPGPRLEFTVDLIAEPIGSFCVERVQYPWGQSGGGIYGEVTDRSGCKSFEGAALSDPIPDTQDCLVYSYDGAGLLTLSHLNTAFNCCVTDLSFTLEIDGNTLTLTEAETLDQGGCACLCLYDLDMAIFNLPPGEYQIVVVEMYEDPIEFTADLTGPVTEESFCVERYDYPWNEGGGGTYGEVIARTDCKTFGGAAQSEPVPSTQDCVVYTYDGVGSLTLTHVNTAFNCCVADLSFTLAIDGNRITITEQEDLDQGGCDCICLYDLEMAVFNLPRGEYQLVVVEMYADPIEFTMDLTGPVTEESFCIERDAYPWR